MLSRRCWHVAESDEAGLVERGVRRAQRRPEIAANEIVTGTTILEEGGARDNGGNSTSFGVGTTPPDENQSIAFRQIRKEVATTTIASRIVVRRIGSSIGVMAKPLLPTILRRPHVLMGSQRLFKVERTITARKSTPSMLLDCFRHKLPTALGNSNRTRWQMPVYTEPHPRRGPQHRQQQTDWQSLRSPRDRRSTTGRDPSVVSFCCVSASRLECGPVWLGKVS